MKRSSSTLLCFAIFLALGTGVAAQETGNEVFQSAEGTVSALYPAVSWKVGETPDWDYVRSFFHEKAVVVIRTSRTQFSVFDVDGFIQDFVTFLKQVNPERAGFQEKVISVRKTEYSDIAQCYVVYEASIPQANRPPQRGIDSFQLLKQDGRWWIISVTNEVEVSGFKIPEELYSK